MKKIIIFLITVYQKLLSPLKRRPCCRFYPTCSQYAIEAVGTHGVVKGLLLSFYRILRCNPFCRGGIDMVPQKNSRMAAGKIIYRSREKS